MIYGVSLLFILIRTLGFNIHGFTIWVKFIRRIIYVYFFEDIMFRSYTNV